MSSTIQAISNAPQMAAAVGDVKETSAVQASEDADAGRSPRPVTDVYTPEEKQEPSGRYWLERGEDGQPRVRYDDPEKAEPCTGSTDQVDREIERLKRKRDELERQIQSETDPGETEELERELARVEQELCQKDNDTYRRRHCEFS